VGAAAAARAAGVILGWQGGRIAEDLNRVTAVWKEFTQRKAFWPHPEQPTTEQQP